MNDTKPVDWAGRKFGQLTEDEKRQVIAEAGEQLSAELTANADAISRAMDPTAITFERDLTYRVIFTRADGQKWPILEAGGKRYDVREVAVSVDIYPDGTFDVQYPKVRHGQAVRQDGSRGAHTPQFLTYMSRFIGDQVDVQTEWFKTEALRTAMTAYNELRTAGPELTA